MRSFGRYRLVEPLASGGMADVWRAEVTGAEGVVKEVALKLVRGEHGARSDFVRMFIQEARLAARLSHANVVQVFEFDQVEGRYYLAMELVRGRHLGRVVERARELGIRLGLARAVHVGAEVAKGLAHAHRLADRGRPLGLVHRDVSPHNVLVSFEGEVKLADFGIARAMSEAGLTDPGTLKGKLAYMAPEQARSGAVDARADVFSLGVVLWELCAGRRLFARDVEAATLAAVLDPAPPSPPSAWNEEVPPELDAVILAALEKDPGRRTGSAQELAGALGSVLLHIARTPDDWDLRALMHRLWPEGATPVPGSAPEATRVRPAPRLAEPEEAGIDAGGAPAGEGRGDAAGDTPAPLEPTAATAALRTPRGAAAPRWRRAALAGLAAALVVALLALAAGRLRGRDAAAGATSVAGDAARGGLAAAPAGASPPRSAPPSATDARPSGGEGAAAGAGIDAAPEAEGARPPGGATSPPGPPSSGGDGSSPAQPPAAAEQRAAPAAAATPSRPGVLHVTASPWAIVTIDGQRAGETPVTRSLPPGRHRIRAAHPRYGKREATVEITAGRRTAWHANLAR